MKKLTCVIVLMFLLAFSSHAQEALLEVYFVDVGQGDSTLVVSGDDVLLVDTGPSGGLTALRNLLEDCGIEEIDYLVLTHPHDDHDANIGYLVANYQIGHLIMPEYADDEEDYGNLLREMAGNGTRIVYPNVGDQYVIGDSIATVLSAAYPSQYPNNKNIWSIVLRVDYGETSVMLTGDAEDINEFAMIDAGLDLDIDVLGVGHHGSYTSSSEAFISAASPEHAVIYCGRNNSYGHPHVETLATLAKYEVAVLRTDLDGTIYLISDGKTYSLSSARFDEEETAEVPVEQTYILNTNTRKFHYPDCSSVRQMKDKNKAEYTGSRDDLIDQGYSPCGNCKP